MHTMDKTPKILTIIGMVFEGVGILGMAIGGLIFKNFANLPGISAQAMDLSQADYNDMIELMNWLGDVLYVISVVVAMLFVLNLYLFIKLMMGKWSEESAKKVYLYQAIWGGINILFNQITGILYLISGVSGYSGHREETNIRDGI